MRQHRSFIGASIVIIAVVVLIQVSPVSLWETSPMYVPIAPPASTTRSTQSASASTALALQPRASTTIPIAPTTTIVVTKKATTTAPSATSTSVVTLIIPNGHYAVPLETGVHESVLEVMHNASASGLVFTGKDYPGMGFFVESIAGKKNANGYYWILYVNGIDSSLGVSQAQVSEGDTIEWKYEKGYH